MQNKLNINESFISKIWEKGGEFYSNLTSTDGEKILVIDYGKRNYDGGPDYKNAKIKVGSRIYQGDIEIHRDFNSWLAHKHKKDSKYNSLILQVVMWDSDNRTNPKLRIKRLVPTVILSKHLNQNIHSIWQEIIDKPSEKLTLPCYDFNKNVSDDLINNLLKELALERLNMKANRIKERLIELEIENNGSVKSDDFLKKSSNWLQAMYEFTFEALGYSKNKEPMLKLAKYVKLKKIKSLISKLNNEKTLLIQSLLFGAGGFLFDLRIGNSYVNKIKEYWNNFKSKLRIELIHRSEWHFFRLRPQNFPTLRIAYGSYLILKILYDDLFKKIIFGFQTDNFNVKKIERYLENLFNTSYDDYWSSNYHFGKESKSKVKLIGKQKIIEIINNVIIPFVYLYAKLFNKELIKKNVLKFFSSLKHSSSNSVLKVIESQILKNRKIKLNTSASEQAATQLYNFYCMRERCMECKIGQSIFRDKGFDYKVIFY